MFVSLKWKAIEFSLFEMLYNVKGLYLYMYTYTCIYVFGLVSLLRIQNTHHITILTYIHHTCTYKEVLVNLFKVCILIMFRHTAEKL